MMRHMSISTGSRSTTMDQLTGDLERARAELVAVRQECEYLRQLVQTSLSAQTVDAGALLAKPDVQIPWSEFAFPAPGGNHDSSITEPLSNTPQAPSTPKASISPTLELGGASLPDDVDAMTEEQAKQRLKVTF